MTEMNEGTDWQLNAETWTALCNSLEPVTAVSRPYERICIRPTENEKLEAYVEEPRPELPEIEENNSEKLLALPPDWEDRPKNDVKTIPPMVAESIREPINKLLTHSLVGLPDEPTVEAELKRCLVTPTELVGVFRLVRELAEDEEGLFSLFQKLMVKLGHADSPDEIAYGRGLEPHSGRDSDNPVDLGLAATVYKYVENPHEYWSDCETLEDYIDRCVENGADRAELETREKYLHHFHSTTYYESLSDDKQQALENWLTAVEATIVPHVEFGDSVLRYSVADVGFSKDRTGVVVLSVVAGAELEC